MGVFVWLSVRLASFEQVLKSKYGDINLVDSDLRFSGGVVKIILALGFSGGFVAGAFGLGGGSIYNPMLLGMGVPPKVSSATGMYLILFSTISTSFIFMIIGQLVIDYCVWTAAWTVLGTVIGLWGSGVYMKKFGR
mmetsp:Transcript_15437/g.26114  ORF Transcript_15437/g.26114 Transcript_15437/m.26114 type:complete len:136 (+) Transcript_15437:992-1399(+)